MDILNKLSTKLKTENIILKNNEEKLSNSNQSKEKENTLGENKEKIDLKLSLIKENSDSSNDLGSQEKNNNIEISMVYQGKLEEKEKNILQIENLIESCNDDLESIEKKIYRYKNTTKDVIMESMVFEDTSMVFVNKKEDEDDTGDKLKYFTNLKNELISLRKKLENLLELYKTEKQLTELKKIELEKLDKLKKEYNKLKHKKKN